MSSRTHSPAPHGGQPGGAGQARPGVWAAPDWTVVGRRDLSAVLSGSSVEDTHVCPVVVRVGATHCRRSWCCGLWLTQENGVSAGRCASI